VCLLKTPKAAKSLEFWDSAPYVPGLLAVLSTLSSLLAGRFGAGQTWNRKSSPPRHQLIALRRQRPGRPRLSCADRLRRVWQNLSWPHCLLAEQRLHLVCGSDRNLPRFVAARRYRFLPLLKFDSDGIFSKDNCPAMPRALVIRAIAVPAPLINQRFPGPRDRHAVASRCIHSGKAAGGACHHGYRLQRL
jgi:hypothetical protein